MGDTVDVHIRIVEGDKERTQVFRGIVIGRRGSGINESFTVRRLVAGEGVERIFPLHSPAIEKIVVKKRGRVRRAKLYYLRDRTGKATKVAERRLEGKKGDILADLAATDQHSNQTRPEEEERKVQPAEAGKEKPASDAEKKT